MAENRIILLGGGGHCRSCIDVIEQSGCFGIAGIVEQPGKPDLEAVLGYPVIGDDSALAALRKQYDYALITLGHSGDSTVRQKLFQQLKTFGFILPVVVSPLAYVSQHAALGEGTIVMHQAVVNANAVIKKNCILNTRALVEHDAVIDDHVHISTAAVVNGGSVVGKGSFVGSGAIVVHGVCLSGNRFFKAGSVITCDRDGRPVGG